MRVRIAPAACLFVFVSAAFAAGAATQATPSPPSESQPQDRPTRSLAADKLGIEFGVTSSKIRRSIIQTRTPWGFVVRSVAPGSLAERAGIARGTIVLEVDGQPLREVRELEAVLAKSKPAQRLVLQCAQRKKNPRLLDRKPWVDRTIEIVLPEPASPHPRTAERLGIEFAVVSSKIRRAVVSTDTPYGFTVRSVAKGSPAEQAGITKGTVVSEVDGRPLRDVAELEILLETAKVGRKLVLRCATRNSNAGLLDRAPWTERLVELEISAPRGEKPKDGQRAKDRD